MPDLSIIVPSRNEIFLFQTIEDIFRKAVRDIEVIAILDGYWPDRLPAEHKNLTLVHFGASYGMRPAINAGVAIAKGKFLLKCDAHCMFDEGFDEILIKDCPDRNCVIVPRRFSLDADKWEPKPDRPAIDYHYLSYPYAKPQEIGMHGQIWHERARERKEILFDEEMSSQGSCWFMPRDHFINCLGELSCEGYGNFVQEFQEIGMKTWLSGGHVFIDKKTWYAHLHKGKRFGRGYFIDKRQMIRGAHYSADFWMHNKWKGQKYTIEWFIQHFWPVPTWPTDFLAHPDKYRNPPVQE